MSALPLLDWFAYHRTMLDSPDVADLATLIGDRTRTTMLLALMSGRTLTATELARAADVSKPTASAHLAKLSAAGMIAVQRSGRHRLVRLANADVAHLVESLVRLAHRGGSGRAPSVRPIDPAFRKARVCYDHLAGDLGVMLLDSLVHRDLVMLRGRRVAVTERGRDWLGAFGIDVSALERQRRPMALACLDWSVRRYHLAGAVGASLLDQFLTLGWARRHRDSRTLTFSAAGERQLRTRFPLPRS